MTTNMSDRTKQKTAVVIFSQCHPYQNLYLINNYPPELRTKSKTPIAIKKIIEPTIASIGATVGNK